MAEDQKRNGILRITFVIPTLNAGNVLDGCLSSIRKQSEKAEIIICDGGSTDNTYEISKKYRCSFFHNMKKLAEYGVQKGVFHTMTEFVVVFAADNELPREDWVEKVIKIFDYSKEVCALWGGVGVLDSDPPISKYFELIQSDPLNWFINKNLEGYIKNTTLFKVDPKKPLCWGANGIVYRTNKVKDIWAQEGYLGDNDAFQTMIEKGRNTVVYFPSLYVLHHHVKSLPDWIHKWQRNMRLHQHPTRNMRWIVPDFKLKLVLWFLYLPVCWIHAIYLAVKYDRNWLYHPICCWSQTIVYGIESIRKKL